jgi:hypothetical protein
MKDVISLSPSIRQAKPHGSTSLNLCLSESYKVEPKQQSLTLPPFILVLIKWVSILLSQVFSYNNVAFKHCSSSSSSFRNSVVALFKSFENLVSKTFNVFVLMLGIPNYLKLVQV